MYSPYHEMDMLQFADEMDRRIRERMPQTKLSKYRQAAALFCRMEDLMEAV